MLNLKCDNNKQMQNCKLNLCCIIYLIGLTTEGFQFPGSGLFQFITFRVMLAMILSLVITTVYGKKLIRVFAEKTIG